MSSDLQDLAPGVKGWYFDTPEAIYIPVILATNPGNGDVSRYLDSLPSDRTIRFPTVMSRKLQGMLERRGYKPVMEWADVYEHYVEVYERKERA